MSTKPEVVRSSFLPLHNVGGKEPFRYLNPFPQKIVQKSENRSDILKSGISVVSGVELKSIRSEFEKELKAIGVTVKSSAKNKVRLGTKDLGLADEGYRISVLQNETVIEGQTASGLFYGIQTFLQLCGFEKGCIPELEIEDWPDFSIRSVMIDMGRGVYTIPLIKRVIRIMAKLKLNILHMHLYDDQLMGVRFKKLPLGKENPHAFPISKLGEIVQYARNYHVHICPELESWAHVGSVLHHYPELYGAPGKWEGSSFGIGQPMLDLLEKIYDEVVPQLDDESYIHLGLDEALWALLPDMKGRDDVNPTWLVGKLYEIVQKVGKKHGKKLKVKIWADHGGRPLPEELKDKIIVQPWGYWARMEKKIHDDVQRYKGEPQTPFVMGGGQSSIHYAGTFHATRNWCREGLNIPNCKGVTICLWEGNFFQRYLVGVFGGAYYAWNAISGPTPNADDPYLEEIYAKVFSRILSWQTLFEDFNESQILKDRGAGVYRGFYTDGAKAGLPVAPTAFLKKPREDNFDA